MISPKVAFVVFGVHKDGLEDPMGQPFIDENIIEGSRQALRNEGIELVEHDIVIASKNEAQACLNRFKKMEDIDAVVLFSGTWVWAGNLIGAVQDFARTGKGVVIWTHPGSQGWRPVGGLVMHAAMKEIDLTHRFVYGSRDDREVLEKITSYCRAGSMVNKLNMSTLGALGGRGMGQTCGAADPSQWMKMFGIDIDSRDTTQLLRIAEAVTDREIAEAREKIQPWFQAEIPQDNTADRSIRLYLALKKIIAEEDWDFYTIQSFPGLGDDYSATCFPQSMMLNDRVATSTLCDYNTALTVILLNGFSPDPVYYGDLQHIDRQNREIKIIGDGACPPALGGTMQPATFAEHGIPTEGEAGGLAVQLVCKPGKGVLARVGRNNGELEMVISRCTMFEPSTQEELDKRRHESGIPFWPHAFITAECDINALIQGWSNEYAVMAYGENVYEDLIAFCEQTGIKPVLP